MPCGPGSVVARPPGTGVAHCFRAGENGLTYLAYGTREPADVCYYPRSNKVAFRGVNLIARVEPLDYWDGRRSRADRIAGCSAALRHLPVLACAVIVLAGCGNSRAPVLVNATTAAPKGFHRFQSLRAGAAFKVPANWTVGPARRGR